MATDNTWSKHNDRQHTSNPHSLTTSLAGLTWSPFRIPYYCKRQLHRCGSFVIIDPKEFVYRPPLQTLTLLHHPSSTFSSFSLILLNSLETGTSSAVHAFLRSAYVISNDKGKPVTFPIPLLLRHSKHPQDDHNFRIELMHILSTLEKCIASKVRSSFIRLRRRSRKRRKGQLDQIRLYVTKLGSYYNGHWFRMALPQHVPFHCAQLINLPGSPLPSNSMQRIRIILTKERTATNNSFLASLTSHP